MFALLRIFVSLDHWQFSFLISCARCSPPFLVFNKKRR